MNNTRSTTARALVANQYIVDAVTHALTSAQDLDATAVHAFADGDVVVLQGNVGSFAEKLSAVVLAWSVPGVASVDNKLTVRELDLESANTPDAAIAEQVGRALLRSAIPIDDLRFVVHQHVATIEGTVKSQRDRIAVRSAVQRTPGVHFVNNLIRVGDAPAIPEFEELAAAACRDLLGRTNLGRLAVRDGDGVDVFPVNFVLHDGDVCFRTAPGSKLVRITASPEVAFEADGHGSRYSWSVVIKGRATRLNTDDEIEASGIDHSPTGFPGDKFNYVRIHTEQISGRRFRHVLQPR